MVFVFVILNITMLLSMLALVYQYFRTLHFSEKLLTISLLYFSQISLTILFLGVIIRDLRVQSLLILNLSISLLIIFALKKNIKASIKNFYYNLSDFSVNLLKTRDYFLYIFLILFGIQLISTLIKIIYLPPYVWDAFTYHLHPVIEWIQQNKIPLYIDTPVLRVNINPLGSKLMHFWFVRFFQDITWIELPQFIHGILLTLSSYIIMLKLKIKKNIALRYAILISFIPSILIQSRTSQDHLVLTSMILMSMIYFINVLYKNDYSQIILLSLSMGLLLGIKINSPLIISLFFISLLLSRGFNKSRVIEFIRKNKVKIIIGFIFFFSVGSYWILKNLFLFDNYFGAKPKSIGSFQSLSIMLITFALVLLLIMVWGKFRKIGFLNKNKIIIIFTAVIILSSGTYFILKKQIDFDKSISENIKLIKAKSKFIKNIYAFPLRIKDTTSYYSPDLKNISGFGVQFFGFGIMAYFIMTIQFIFKKKRIMGISGFVMIFSIILLMSYFFYYFSPFNYRLFMFFPIFGIILWTSVLSKLDMNKYASAYLDVLILIMIIFNSLVCYYESNTSSYKSNTLFTINNPFDRTSIKYSQFLGKNEWKFIDQYISKEQPICYSGGIDSWIFPYFDNQMKRRVYYINSLPGFKINVQHINGKTKNLVEFTPELKKSLIKKKIHFIHMNTRGTYSQNHLFIEKNDRNVIRITGDLYYFKWDN